MTKKVTAARVKRGGWTTKYRQTSPTATNGVVTKPIFARHAGVAVFFAARATRSAYHAGVMWASRRSPGSGMPMSGGSRSFPCSGPPPAVRSALCRGPAPVVKSHRSHWSTTFLRFTPGKIALSILERHFFASPPPKPRHRRSRSLTNSAGKLCHLLPVQLLNPEFSGVN